MLQSQKLQIEILSQSAILDQEAKLLKRNSISIEMLRNSNLWSEPFKEFTHHIEVLPDSKSNIRALYYCFLYIMYESGDNEVAQELERRLKSYVYSVSIKLDQYRLSEIQPQYRNLYDNLSLKKMFVEFAHNLSSTRCEGRVMKMLKQYPTMDFVLILVFRSIYHLDYVQPWTFMSPINTQKFVECLSSRLKVNLNIPQPKTFVVNKNCIKFIEKSQGCYIIKLQESKITNEFHQSTQDSLPISSDFDDEEIETGENTPKFKSIEFADSQQDAIVCSFGVNLPINKEISSSFNQEQPQQNLVQNSTYKEIQSSPLNFKIDMHKRNIIEEIESPCFMVNNQVYNYDSPKKLPEKKHQRSNSQKLPKVQFDEQDIYDGLTSPQILNIMSPHIVKQINQKKQKSISQLYDNFNLQIPKQTLRIHLPKDTTNRRINEGRTIETDRIIRNNYSLTPNSPQKQRQSCELKQVRNKTDNISLRQIISFFKPQVVSNISPRFNIPWPSPENSQQFKKVSNSHYIYLESGKRHQKIDMLRR